MTLSLFATALFALIVSWRLFAPFFGENKEGELTESVSEQTLLDRRRDLLLQELELDHATGAIDAEDFDELRRELE